MKKQEKGDCMECEVKLAVIYVLLHKVIDKSLENQIADCGK
jgi:hypothetical protein